LFTATDLPNLTGLKHQRMKNAISTMDSIRRIREDLAGMADPKTRESGMTFFKEQVKLYGVTAPAVARLAKAHFNTFETPHKPMVFGLCEELWQSGYLEESLIACDWSYAVRRQYEPADFETFERWISAYVTNWASCDTLCNHTVGEFVEMYPEFLERLKSFTASENRWMKRAAAVSLIVPARKGKFLSDVFEIAGLLLTDTDDLVQKGYGWMLKAASQAHRQEVFGYVMAEKSRMPRTALRYAIEKMPEEMRASAMKRDHGDS
jgi:3-methyladenine DNA glycosylase AlkD